MLPSAVFLRQKLPLRSAMFLIVIAMLIATATATVNENGSHPKVYARQQQDPHSTSSTPTPSTSTSTTPTSSSSSTPPPVSAPPAAPVPSPAQVPALKPGSSGGTVIGPGTHGGSMGNSTVFGPSSVIDPRRPVSRLSMVQPKQNTANPPLFPVGGNIVFEWAFDNTTLVFPPANLTVEISLTSNPKMIWPIANVSGTTTSVVWNTAAVTNPNLFMGYYTLSVYETKIGKQGVATSGHLMPYSDLQLGLYIPEPYVPRTGVFCQTCNHGEKVQSSPSRLVYGSILSLLVLGAVNLL